MTAAEQYRFFCLSLSFNILAEQARSMGKRLIGVLVNDMLDWKLEDTSPPMSFTPLLDAPLLPPPNPWVGGHWVPLPSKPEVRSVSTMTDPVTVTAVATADGPAQWSSLSSNDNFGFN